MKYLVMECHSAYAVVLSEDGRFLKAANLHYEVGQHVSEILEVQLPEKQRVQKKNNRWVKTLGTLAACAAIAVMSLFYMNRMPYASVYMTINPEVRIDVNRRDRVMAVEGINRDGMELVEGYSHKDKELDQVVDDLVDRAIDQGYLHEGGVITVSLDADQQWRDSHEAHINEHLNRHLADKITVTVEVESKNQPAPEETEETAPEKITPIVIPIEPESYGDSDYGKTSDDDDRDDKDDRDDDDDRDDEDERDEDRDDEDERDEDREDQEDRDDDDDQDDRDDREEEDDRDDSETPYVKKTSQDKKMTETEKPSRDKDDGDSGYDRQEKQTSDDRKQAASDYDREDGIEDERDDKDDEDDEEEEEKDSSDYK